MTANPSTAEKQAFSGQPTGMPTNKTMDERRLVDKNFSLRLPTALLLTGTFFFWAALRPPDVGHDTQLYLRTIELYLVPDSTRFPDLLFNAIATIISNILNDVPGGKEFSGRLFLVVVALIESALMVQILREKKYIAESFILAVSYGPLMFLDIIRQGVAMLLAGVFFSGKKRRYLYILGAFSTHVVAAVSLLAVPPKKKYLLLYIILLSLIVAVAFILIDQFEARLEFYSRTEGYFSDSDIDKAVSFSLDAFSAANMFVILFFIYAAAVRGFTKVEAIILLILYVASVFLPLLYRIYLFYFFCLSCSRDVLINSTKVKYIVFDVLYAAVILRFSLNAFFTFDVGR